MTLKIVVPSDVERGCSNDGAVDQNPEIAARLAALSRIGCYETRTHHFTGTHL